MFNFLYNFTTRCFILNLPNTFSMNFKMIWSITSQEVYGDVIDVVDAG